MFSRNRVLSAYKRLQYGVATGAFALSVFLVNGAAFPGAADALAGGNGSESNPYKIANCAQLQEMYSFDNYNAYYNKSYVLTANIDCSAVTNFAPLYDNDEYTFEGSLNGQGYTISNLNISGSSYQSGLFGYVANATIKNLNLDHVTVAGNSNYETGALAGVANGTSITDVYAKNVNISGGSDTGGLVGLLLDYGNGASVQRSSVSGTVSGTSRTGGLIGHVLNDGGGQVTVQKVFSAADVSATGSHVGGLIGEVETSGSESGGTQTTIMNTYAWRTVNAPSSDNVGGLIGSLDSNGAYQSDISVVNSYSWDNITGHFSVGGLVGLIYSAVEGGQGTYTIHHDFATAVDSAQYDGEDYSGGGLVGANDAGSALQVHDVYYDAGLSNASSCDIHSTITCTAINTDENPQANYFVNNSSNQPMDEWDFADVWQTNTGTSPVFKGFGVQPVANEGGQNSDGDGQSDTVETAAPGNGDVNQDGTPDSQQAKVSSFVNSVTGNYAALETSGDCEQNNSAEVVDAGANSVKDASYVYPAGLMNFNISCGNPGDTTTVTQYYFGDYDAAQYTARKYNSNTKTYTTIPGATIANVTIGGEKALKITYSITDGGSLDADGMVNGTIVDPAGPAIKYTAPNDTASTPGTPNTGHGVAHQNVSLTIATYGVATAVLVSLALLTRRFARSK